MVKAPFDPNVLVVKIGLGLVILYIVTSIINFSALSNDEETCMARIYDLTDKSISNKCAAVGTEATCIADTGCVWTAPAIFRPNVDYSQLVPQTWKWIMVSIAGFFAWRMGMGGGRWDKKKFASVILTAVILYILYAKVLQPMMPDALPTLEFAAYQLRTISPPGLQSIFG